MITHIWSYGPLNIGHKIVSCLKHKTKKKTKKKKKKKKTFKIFSRSFIEMFTARRRAEHKKHTRGIPTFGVMAI